MKAGDKEEWIKNTGVKPDEKKGFIIIVTGVVVSCDVGYNHHACSDCDWNLNSPCLITHYKYRRDEGDAMLIPVTDLVGGAQQAVDKGYEFISVDAKSVICQLQCWFHQQEDKSFECSNCEAVRCNLDDDYKFCDGCGAKIKERTDYEYGY